MLKIIADRVNQILNRLRTVITGFLNNQPVQIGESFIMA